MSFLDKIFCASPQCQNQCGRKMSEEEKDMLYKSIRKNPRIPQYLLSYAYFCGGQELKKTKNDL